MRENVTIEGLDELIRDIHAAGGNANKLVRGAITNSTNKIVSNTRSRAPHRTGTLQRSILPEVNNLEGEVKVNEKYGIYHEEGTGIYGPQGRMIRPSAGKKVLAFKVGGRMVFARQVKGIRKRPFFKPGVAASQGYIQQQFDKVMDIMMTQLAGRK